uniref:Uncharacterized protein n=1 Tax=Ananas comosus var. bracteatus TaxID=296719 RepID=A0A6V7QHQ2_ANACO|nr:unnamed protein product [Ananas comosus var. bracteatus]
MVQFWVKFALFLHPSSSSSFFLSAPHPAAHLGRLDYDQSGMLGVRIALMVVAENDNCAAAAGFSDVGFTLSFYWIDVTLRPALFTVPRNGSWPLQYDVQAAPVPLDADVMHAMVADTM